MKDGALRPHPESQRDPHWDRRGSTSDHGQTIWNPFDVFAVDGLQKLGTAWR
jgi:hypothetical protein